MPHQYRAVRKNLGKDKYRINMIPIWAALLKPVAICGNIHHILKILQKKRINKFCIGVSQHQ